MKEICLNSMIPLFRYSQERLCDLENWKGITNEDPVHVYGWIFKDSIKCRGPVQEREIDGIVVKYNRVTHEVYVPDLIERTINTLCNIRNYLEWEKWFFSLFFNIILFFSLVFSEIINILKLMLPCLIYFSVELNEKRR